MPHASLLLIGDAAHVMCPVGGVGIYYAIQDAAVAVNVLRRSPKDSRIEQCQQAAIESPDWLDQQDQLAAFTFNSSHRVVEGVTQGSQLYEGRDAHATGAAIVQVVEAARTGQPLAGRSSRERPDR